MTFAVTVTHARPSPVLPEGQGPQTKSSSPRGKHSTPKFKSGKLITLYKGYQGSIFMITFVNYIRVFELVLGRSKS